MNQKNKEFHDKLYKLAKDQIQFSLVNIKDNEYSFKCPVCGNTSDKSLFIFIYKEGKHTLSGDGRILDWFEQKRIYNGKFCLKSKQKDVTEYQTLEYHCHNKCDLDHIFNLFWDKFGVKIDNKQFTLEETINKIESNWGSNFVIIENFTYLPISTKLKFLFKHKKLQHQRL